jgi:hypothetical protein
MVFDIMDAPWIHQGSYVSIFRSLPSWKVDVSECHPRSLRGHWRFLRRVLVVFDIMDAPRIHQGKWTNSWVFQSVIQGV